MLDIDAVAADIADVAERLGKPIRKLLRSEYVNNGQHGWRWEKFHKSWAAMRYHAAVEAGEGPAEDPAKREGVNLRNSSTRQLERNHGRAEYLAERLELALSSAVERNPVKLSNPQKTWAKADASEYSITALWSDLHYGVKVDPREVLGSEYSWQIAARRSALFALQVAEYKTHHRDRTGLHFVLNGDIIEGVIHLSEANIDPLAVQVWGAAKILIGAIDFLRQHFPWIVVTCVPGNHDRAVYRSPGRATSQKWDNHATSIFLAIQMAFRHADDVTVNVNRSPIGAYETPGGRIIATHGDTAPSISNPGKSLNTKAVEDRLNRMRVSGEMGDFRAILYGHWHWAANFMVGAIDTVVNGSMIGGGSFTQNGVGIFNPPPQQVLFESAPGYPIGDFRKVFLRPADDRSDLDEIIPTPDLI